MNFTLENFKFKKFHLCLLSKIENTNYLEEIEKKDEDIVVFNPSYV